MPASGKAASEFAKQLTSMTRMNGFMRSYYEDQFDDMLHNGDKATAQQLRKASLNQKLPVMTRTLALRIYLGAVLPDMRQQQIILRRCLRDPHPDVRFAAAAALADGWVEPTRSILKDLRECLHDGYAPIRGCARKVLGI